MPVAIVTAAVVVACSSSSSSSTHSCAQYVLCTQSGNEFVCDCDGGTHPTCPTSAQIWEPCDAPSRSCMSCEEGATIGCLCQASEDGGPPSWLCVGGGDACQ